MIDNRVLPSTMDEWIETFGAELTYHVVSAFLQHADEKGRVSKRQLAPFLRKLQVFTTDEEMKQIIVEMDPRHRGFSTVGDLRVVLLRLSGVMFSSEDILEGFQVFDSDHDGYVTLEDLQRVLGDEDSPETLSAIMQAADLDGDGRLSYEEFQMVIFS